jgi:Domain of unknown function (DUF2017)
VAKGFHRTRRGVRAGLDEDHRALLDHVLGEVHDLLDDGHGGSGPDEDPLTRLVGIGTAVAPPADPALARLLPDAHRDDGPAAAEFRRYTEGGLRERKRSGLATARACLARPGPILLDDAEAQAWVVALTDLRLVLASRLGLQREEDHDRLAESVTPGEPEDNQVVFLLMVYDFLSWLQETLVEALTAELPD